MRFPTRSVPSLFSVMLRPVMPILVAALCSAAVMSTEVVAATERTIDFTLQDLDGNTHTLSAYRGKWVVVNFWATTCPPCIREMPELSDFHNRHKDRDAVVLGLNFEDIRASWMRRFLDSVEVSYPILPWGTSPSTPFGPVIALPTTFIVSPDGSSVARYTGAVTAADIEAYIESKNDAGQQENPATEHKAQLE